MEAAEVRPGYELWRPNREKAETKATKALVAFVLLVSAGLLLVVTLGGWERLEGSQVGAITIAWAGLYVLFALLVARWNRGVLPVASALAIIMVIFAAIAAPGWFARDKTGLDAPALPEELLGMLTLLVIPVQLLLIVVAMIGFNQEWHVEEERPVGELAGEDHPEPTDADLAAPEYPEELPEAGEEPPPGAGEEPSPGAGEEPPPEAGEEWPRPGGRGPL